MNRKDKYRERLPINEWPDIERKMAIIARMTSDPPPLKLKTEVPYLQEESDVVTYFSDGSVQSGRSTPIG